MASVESKTLTCDSFSSTLIAGLDKLWKDNQFCDIILKVEEREFSCHKNVLAANSEYFTSVFTRDFKEKDKNLIVLPREFEILPFQTLLNYFYSANLVLTSENAEGVFKVADYMRLDNIVELSAGYLEETLESSNCIRRFRMLDSLQFKRPCVESLYKAAARLIVEETIKESATDDFLEIGGELIPKIVSSNNQPENAESLFLFVVKWVGHDEGSRQTFLGNLLQSIPVAGLSFKFFTARMKTDELLRRHLDGVQWLLDSVVPQVTVEPPPVPAVVERIVRVDPPKSLFVANWESPTVCYQVPLSNPSMSRVWEQPNITNFCAVSHKRRIYLMCGANTKKTFMLEEERDEWVESNLNLYFDRYGPGTIVWDDDLFVIGHGAYGGSCSCVKFNFEAEETVSLPNMKEKRYRPGVGLYENSIYACGGRSKTIERFDPREGQWCNAGRFNTDIGECSSTTVGNSLYSIDRDNGGMGRFDFRSGSSETISSLSADGKKYWITSLDDHIYVSKGMGSILKYDRESLAWVEFRNHLTLESPIIVPWV